MITVTELRGYREIGGQIASVRTAADTKWRLTLLSHVSSGKDLLWEQSQAQRQDSQEYCVDKDVIHTIQKVDNVVTT